MDPIQQRINERKIYEEIVTIIVDYVYQEFGNDEAARLRVYEKVAENFDGMVKALRPPASREETLIGIIGEESDG